MLLRRRTTWVAALLATAALALVWSRRGVELSLQHDHAVVGRILVPACRASVAATEVAEAAAVLDEPSRIATTRDALVAALARAEGATADFGFGPGDAAPEFAPPTAGPRRLSEVASELLRAQDNPLLLVHTWQPASLARVGARRGWLGPLAAEVFASSRTISVAVSENPEDGWMRITLALEFADGAAAEAALARLTAANGDHGQLGFVAQPGYERIVRSTRLVVIRLDTRAEAAATHLRRR